MTTLPDAATKSAASIASPEVDIFEITPDGAKLVDTIAKDRPAVVHFPHMGAFNDPSSDPEAIRGNNRFIRNLYTGGEAPNVSQAVYVVQRRTPVSNDFEVAVLGMHASNPDLATPTARNIANKLFLPMISDIKPGMDAAACVENAQRAMSKVLLSGNSLGTSYQQQVCNAITEGMIEKGYNPTQIKDVMNSLTAVSMGTVIPVHKSTVCKDMPTLHVTVQGDTVTDRFAPLNDLTIDADDNQNVQKMRNGRHLCIQEPLRSPSDNTVRFAKLVPLHESADVNNPMTHLNIDPANPPRTAEDFRRALKDTPVQWAVEATEASKIAHNPMITANRTGMATPTMLTLQTSTASPALNGFIDESLLAADASVKSGTIRDGAALLDRTEFKYLTEPAREASGAAVTASKQNFRQLFGSAVKKATQSILR